jgi:hypothetical protein
MIGGGAAMADINTDQLRLMKHAIGFDRDKVKRGKYVAWRNCFVNGKKPDDEWEKLVNQGLAEKYSRFCEICYYVSEEGINLLSEILDVKIIEE